MGPRFKLAQAYVPISGWIDCLATGGGTMQAQSCNTTLGGRNGNY